MNKSKFKSVKFKPFNAEMYYSSQEMWVNSFGLCGDSSCVLKVTDSCIESHPDLFEVEKAEREFEPCKYYKAKLASISDFEIVKYWGSYFTFSGMTTKYWKEDLFEIGEKIEL